MACRVTSVTGVWHRGLLVIGRLALANVLERAAELMPGAVDVGLYGAEREVEGRGDFFVRPALHMAQHDARTVFRPKARDGAFDGSAQLSGLELVERRFL